MFLDRYSSGYYIDYFEFFFLKVLWTPGVGWDCLFGNKCFISVCHDVCQVWCSLVDEVVVRS